jgi:hypothetical protein
MTDVPALLCLLVSLYGCQRALRATRDRAALAWLCGSAALNVVDGTVRQIAWLGALVIVPSAFWLLRKRKGFKTAGVVTWCLSSLSIALLMAWFLRQPYALPEHIIRGNLDGLAVWHILRISVYGTLEVMCFSLPVLIAWIFELRFLNRRRWLQIVGLCAVSAPLLLLAAHYNKIQGRLPPWSANVVTRYGILWSIPLLGDRPQILPITITSIIAVVLIASLAGFVIWLRRNVRKDWLRSRLRERSGRSEELSLPETCVLLLPFTIIYFGLLLPRAAFPSMFFDVWDRYYLPLILAAVILLLRLLKQKQHEVPVICYAALLAFSFFSITATHDMFCAYRATASVRAALEANGVAPSAISGPWEEDGANQIIAQGYVNDNRIVNPPGAYRPIENAPLLNCGYWFGPLVPALHFHYVLMAQKMKCVVPAQYPDVTYTTWLPPYRRTIYIEREPLP